MERRFHWQSSSFSDRLGIASIRATPGRKTWECQRIPRPREGTASKWRANANACAYPHHAGRNGQGEPSTRAPIDRAANRNGWKNFTWPIHRFPSNAGSWKDRRLTKSCAKPVKANCDLIVMGTHGRSGLSRLLMGSVAEGAIRKAPCPVLTVKIPLQRGQQEAWNKAPILNKVRSPPT